MQKYSFLMSVYCKENQDYLEQSIISMLAQTAKPDEIIIVKDGPLTPELDGVIDKYAADKELFTVISLEKNGGLGNALNVGISASRNELIARMDSDDICLPDRCEKTLVKFAENEELLIVGGQIKEFSGNVDNVVASRIVPAKYNDIVKFSKRRSPFNHPTVMYKKSVILKEGGYPSSGRKEDLDLFLLLLSKGYLAENLEDIVLYYRADEENFKRRKNWKNCKEHIEIIKKYKKRGYCSAFDYLYVLVGQTLFHILPEGISKRLNNRYLRKKETK